MLPLLILFLICIANVAAQENNTVPTTTPTLEQTTTMEPTTTFYPTETPTRAPIPAPVPQRPCYTNLTEIEDLVKLKDPFILEKYILCPNTIYQMSTSYSETDAQTTDNGFRTILTRSNSIYQCGVDGKSSNNCIIKGGSYQVMHEYYNYGKENKVNVVMKGLTFEDAKDAALIVAAPGDISFIDCIFRNHKNLGVMPILFSYTVNRKLKAIASMPSGRDKTRRIVQYYHDILHDPIAFQKLKADDTRSHQRRLQGGDIIETQKVTVDGCIFENNVHGPDSSLTINGVISVEAASNELVILNSIFRNNSFTVPTEGSNGFAISAVEGAKINITNVCFIDNKFIGDGVVVVEGSADDFVSKNVFGTVDPELKCPFASIGSDTCVVYDSNTCAAFNLGNQSAVNVPAPVPITSPVAATSNGNIKTGLSLVFWLSSIALLL